MFSKKYYGSIKPTFTPVLLAAVGTLATSVHAAPIINFVNASAQAQGAAVPSIGTSTSNSFGGYSATSNSAGSSNSGYSASAGGYASTRYDTSSYASISGGGVASSALRISQDITNSTAVMQHYTFNFQIYRGGGGVSLNSSTPLINGEYGQWGYLVNVGLQSGANSTNLFRSGVTVRAEQTGSGLNLTSNAVSGGSALDDISSSSDSSGVSYRWGVTNRVVEFDLLAGASTSLVYDMSAFASGNSALYTSTFPCGGYGDGYGYGDGEGYGTFIQTTTQSTCTSTNTKLSASGTTHDPGTLNGATFGTLSSSPTNVPLPGALALVALGIGLIGMKGRKRQQ